MLEFVHFGLTSQDINNSAQPLALKEALHDQWRPRLDKVVHEINQRAEEWADIPMLARTHGQPASPTTLGKEMRVYGYRLERQLALLDLVPQTIKFGLIDFCRDIWMYVSMEYFKQKIKEGEVGSSAMPHKVNPIDFENAEGNLGIAVAYLEHLAHKLPISRLQRDLTDSTVMRNLGMPVAHMMIAFSSILKGLDKLILHEETILADLDDALPVVAEALQTILRREGYPKPYEALKKLTRTNEKLTREHLEDFIDHLDVSPEVKEEMKKITPRNYTGVYSK